jgi:alkyl hydroperoxide reductase subunit AhpF
MPNGAEPHTLTAQELTVAKGRLEALENPVIVKVLLTRNPLSVHFRKFTDDLAAASDKFQPLYMTSSDDGPPAIELKANLRYLALPGGREFDPFLQSLISYSERKAMLSKRSLAALETFMTPTRFEVMISPACPHCPLVVGLVNQLALASTYLEVSIIDITLFDDFVGKYSVRAVPTVVIDGQDKLAGNVSEEVLVDRLTNTQIPSKK